VFGVFWADSRRNMSSKAHEKCTLRLAILRVVKGLCVTRDLSKN